MLPAANSCSSGFHRWVRAAVDQRDARPALAAERVAEPRRELQPARSAADDYNLVHRLALNTFR